MNIKLKDVEWTAAFDTLLAIEHFAERMYADRRHNPRNQERYDALASIVLPLRKAVDADVGERSSSKRVNMWTGSVEP